MERLSVEQPTLYITIPPAVDFLDGLIARLKTFYGVQVLTLDGRIRISGPIDKLVEAQNYALRFIGSEYTNVVHLSSDTLSIFQQTTLLRHFEEEFNVIICTKGMHELTLRGRQCDVARLEDCLKKLETVCQQYIPVMTPFKQESLRLLCQKFSIMFHELPSKPSVQMALLMHFSSLLDNSRNKLNTKPPAFMEVYRKSAAMTQPLQPQDQAPPPPPNVPIGRSRRGRSASTRRVSKSALTSALPNATRKLRSVVIDGSNVAFAHGKQQKFSPDGIWLALNFFIKRGHTNVVAVVPRFRQSLGGKLFDQLERAGYLCYSSARIVNDDHQIADDDKIILQLAIETDAVVVSNDQFRNYRDINEQFRDVIDNRLLPYTLALNTFLIPDDPHGRKGRSLSECLCLPDNQHTEA